MVILFFGEFRSCLGCFRDGLLWFVFVNIINGREAHFKWKENPVFDIALL